MTICLQVFRQCLPSKVFIAIISKFVFCFFSGESKPHVYLQLISISFTYAYLHSALQSQDFFKSECIILRLVILSDFSPLDGLLLNDYHCCDFRCHGEQQMMEWKVLVKLGSKICAKTQRYKNHTVTSCCSSMSLCLNAFGSSACWTLNILLFFSIQCACCHLHQECINCSIFFAFTVIFFYFCCNIFFFLVLLHSYGYSSWPVSLVKL